VSNIGVELRFFLCSYALLFGILAIRFTETWLSLTCAGIALIGVVAGFGTLAGHRDVEPERLSVARIEDHGGEVAGYLAAYLLPFVTVPEPGTRDLIAYVLFLFVNGVVYVRSSLVQLNPTLYLAGWRVYSVELAAGGWSGFLISRARPRAGQPIDAVRLTDRQYVHYERDHDS